ncbi:MAG: hypothetical protein R3F60_22075 [bacterium]
MAFTPTTFHASPAMVRPGERAAWSCIFLSPRVRWCHANAPNHPLCRVVADGAPVTEHPMPEVTPQQHAQFEEQGHVVIGPILPPAEVARLRQAFEAQAAAWAAEIDTPLDDYLAVVSQWTNVWDTTPCSGSSSTTSGLPPSPRSSSGASGCASSTTT